jgi:hypothetical protein
VTELDRILVSLGRLGAIEWFRISVGTDPADGLVRPAMVVWRYGVSHPMAIQVVRHAIDLPDGSIEWYFDTRGKNWGLMPVLLKQTLDQHLTDSYTGVLTDFKRDNQEFCRIATRDLLDIMSRIEEFDLVT